jgi:3D (Asp-Asp-Asp) domain-containing protein
MKHWKKTIRIGVPTAVVLSLLLGAGDVYPRGETLAYVPIDMHEPDIDDYVIEPTLRVSLLPPLGITVTAYSSTVDQCDDTPFLTASMTAVRPGVIALSRDLIRRYNPEAPFSYGDEVFVEGYGMFTVEDTMNKRYSRRADIWFPSRSEARDFGKKSLTISMARQGGSVDSDRKSSSAP